MRNSTLKIRNIAKSISKKTITILMYPIFNRFGYIEARHVPTDFPKSHYYQTATTYNHFVGLHSLPYSKAWIASKRENASIRGGEFVPWITYPALDFLEKLALHNFKVLEFGSGASTLWFSRKCKAVKSYEFDSNYFHKIKKFVNSTQALIEDATSQSKSTFSQELVENLKSLLGNDRGQSDLEPEFWSTFNPTEFKSKIANEIRDADLIFIDGGPRNFLMGLVSENTKANVVIVVDNSDVEYVRLGIPSLLAMGFVEIPLSGPGPLNPYEWQTSIFIKSLEPLRK